MFLGFIQHIAKGCDDMSSDDVVRAYLEDAAKKDEIQKGSDFDIDTVDMIRVYLENAVKRDKERHIHNEQMAKDIIANMNKEKRSAPAVKTSDEEWEQLQRDTTRGYILR